MATKTKSTKAVKKPAVKHIGLVKNDAYLQPYEDAIRGRHEHALWKLNVLTNNGKTKLTDFANGHKYYGLQKMLLPSMTTQSCFLHTRRTLDSPSDRARAISTMVQHSLGMMSSP